ncbi:MAG: antibiotic biosynthesis monooxygenase [Agrobacterium cavarae]
MPEYDVIHRIDKFKIPEEALEAFVARVSETHHTIDTLDGCLRNEVLVKTSGNGEYNVVTHVVWQDQSCLDAAILHMKDFHDRRGGKPPLPAGAVEDRAVYRSVLT